MPTLPSHSLPPYLAKALADGRAVDTTPRRLTEDDRLTEDEFNAAHDLGIGGMGRGDASRTYDVNIVEALVSDKVRKPRKPKALLPASWSVTLTLPCVVRSEANVRDHWSARRKRFQAQEMDLWASWRVSPCALNIGQWRLRLPLRITLTHVGRKMDSDNLAGSMKGLRDSLARLIGIDDGDERVKWDYDQDVTTSGPVGVRVTIEKV